MFYQINDMMSENILSNNWYVISNKWYDEREYISKQIFIRGKRMFFQVNDMVNENVLSNKWYDEREYIIK